MDRFRLVHPFLFAITPILFLYGPNSGTTSLGEILRPCLALTAVTLGAVLGLVWLFRDGPKAAMVVTAFWVLFFGYGYLLTIVRVMDEVAPSARKIFWHPALPFLLFALISLVTFSVLRTPHKRELANLVSFTGLCLVAFQLAEIVKVRLSEVPGTLGSTLTHSNVPPRRLPHVFYIVLDAYGRQMFCGSCISSTIPRFWIISSGKGSTLQQQAVPIIARPICRLLPL